jgi:hypothetical protein
MLSCFRLGRQLLLNSRAKGVPIVTENNAEVYIGVVDGFLAVANYFQLEGKFDTTHTPRSMYSINNLILGQYVPAFQSIYGDCHTLTIGRIFDRLDFVDDARFFRAKLAQTMTFGSMLGWFSWRGLFGIATNLTSPQHSHSAAFVDTLTRYRSLLASMLFDARLLRPLVPINGASLPRVVGPSADISMIQCAVWQSRNTTIAMVINACNARQTVRLRLDSSLYNLPISNNIAYRVDINGSSKLFQRFDAILKLDIDLSPIDVLLLTLNSQL